MKTRSLLFLLLFVLGLTSCKKWIVDKLFEKIDLVREKPPGILCTPASSGTTIENSELSFNKNHFFCVDIDMNADDFETMRHESRFGPDIRDQNGAVALAAALEYVLQCDRPIPSYYKWYAANISIDGLTNTNIGVRKKGLLGSVLSPDPSLRINTDRNVGGQNLASVSNLTFNNNIEDKSNIIQCVNYKIFELAGYPAPRINLANLSINGEAIGVYSHLEPIDERFLQRYFGNSAGDLYEAEVADFRNKWMPRWQTKTATTDGTFQPIRNVANVLENSSDAALLDDLNQYINIDRFITYWCLEVILNHKDGFCVNRNNTYIYFDPNDGGRATFIPSGINQFNVKNDQVFGDFVGAELPRRLSRIPQINQLFLAELERLLNLVWDEPTLLALVDHYTTQIQTAEIHPEHTLYADSLKSWIMNRGQVIAGYLQIGLPTGQEKPSNTCHND